MKRLSTGGFTLIETLVAITILSFAVAGPLYAASRAFVAAEISREQLVASYLAQEGIEYVRALRDQEYLTMYSTNPSVAWTNFVSNIGSVCASPSFCTLDPMLTIGYGSGYALANCPSGVCGPLYLNSNVYRQQVGGTVTPFTRKIQVTPVTATDELVVSTVTWNSRGSHTVTVTDHLTPWQ